MSQASRRRFMARSFRCVHTLHWCTHWTCNLIHLRFRVMGIHYQMEADSMHPIRMAETSCSHNQESHLIRSVQCLLCAQRSNFLAAFSRDIYVLSHCRLIPTTTCNCARSLRTKTSQDRTICAPFQPAVACG